jgi:hypothetical protein
MPGGLIQLVAYGVQDLYLTGDPQITFFKVIYRRHTNFSVESVIQNFSDPADFGKTVACTLSRAGDLVEKIFLYVQLPSIPLFLNSDGSVNNISKFAWVRSLGYALIQEITIEIGGKLIDKQYGEWLYIWSQITNRQDMGLAKMIGNLPELYDFSNGKNGYELYIPLAFWFCKNTGLALPLIALASSDVKINIMFSRLEDCIRLGPTYSIQVLDDVVAFNPGDYIVQTVGGQSIYGYFINYDYLSKNLYYIKIQNQNASNQKFQSLQEPTSSSGIVNNITYQNNVPYRIYNALTNQYCTPTPNLQETIQTPNLPYSPKFVNSFLYVNYVYLDTDERLKFARSNHEYLIEQIQYNQLLNVRSPNVKQNLTLNHPCKSHYWIAQLDSLVGAGTINDVFNYTTSPVRYPEDNVRFPKEKFYGSDLVKSAELQLNGRPRSTIRDSQYFNISEPYQYHYRGPVPGINMYSFCINPEDHQPSAACNMSKIDYINMQMTLDNSINTQNMCQIRSYTINYNILRIFFNLGGIAFV